MADLTSMHSPTTGAPLARRDIAPNITAWVAVDGSGQAITHSEAFALGQEDELQRLWLAAHRSTDSGHVCPCPLKQTMALATIDLDFDEAVDDDQAEGDSTVAVDVCTNCQMLWFDAGELESLPADQKDAEPTAEEIAQLRSITTKWSKEMDEILASREVIADNDTLHERFTNSMMRSITKNPGFLRALHRVSWEPPGVDADGDGQTELN
jgi:Zn-finger nucleic acid-binding protein